VIVLALCGLGLASCGSVQAPKPPANFAWADIAPILTPMIYRQLWGGKCGDPNLKDKTVFLADLKSAGAAPELVAEAKAEAARIEAGERKTLKEYVCTVELAESTEKNAAVAQKAWAELKSRKPSP
jgi:hypothetical protein